MHTRRVLPVLIALMAAVAWLMPAPVTAQQRSVPRKPLPYVLPDGTLMFVSVPDFQAARRHLNTWDLKKVYDLPAMQGFLAPMIEMMDAQVEQMNQQLKDQINMDLEQLLGLLAGQVSLAVIDASVQDMQEFRGPSPEMMQMANILLAIDVDRSTETFGRALNWMQQELANAAQLRIIKHADAEITEVSQKREASNDDDGDGDGDGDAGQKFYYVIYRQTLFFSLALDTLKNTIDLYASATGSGTVGASRKFQKVRQNLAAAGELAYFYLDIETFMGKVRGTVPEDAHENFDKTLEVSGIGAIKAFGGQWVIRPNGMLQDNFFLYVPGARKGLMQVLSLPPTSFTTLKHVPANALSYTSFNFDLELLWVEVLEAVRAFSPEAYLDLQENLEQQAENGFDISANLFGAVGGEMATWSVAEADGPNHSTVWISLKNPAGFSTLLGNAISAILEETEGQAPITIHEVGDMKVYEIDMSDNMRMQLDMIENADMPPFMRELIGTFMRQRTPTSWHLAVVRNAFIGTTDRAQLTAIVNNPNGIERHLGTNPAFQRSREAGFSMPSYFAWSDWPQMIGMTWPLLEELVAGLAAEAKEGNLPSDIPFDFTQFPTTEAVRAIFSAGADIEARNNLDGLLLRTRGLSVVAVVGAAVAGIVRQQMAPPRWEEPGFPGEEWPMPDDGDDDDDDNGMDNR